MKKLRIFLILCVGLPLTYAQQVSYFDSKISGEDITYFSPFHEFANQALLTRCNGHSPIVFAAQNGAENSELVHYKFLVGFSNGTSGGDRLFDVSLNDSILFTFKTKKKWISDSSLHFTSAFSPKAYYQFTLLEKDVNNDVFGYLEVVMPRTRSNDSHFQIQGRNAQSRDWLMVFQFKPHFESQVQAENLVYRASQKRPLSVKAFIPDGVDSLLIRSVFIQQKLAVKPGYFQQSFAVYPADFVGTDDIVIKTSGNMPHSETVQRVQVQELKPFTFCIIHHSHNDIGYSHLQTEVARIQCTNIRSALRWIASTEATGQKAVWHVESLWAVENFLNDASPAEEKAFVSAVRSGKMVLSVNYANCLTGLMQAEEIQWLCAYAHLLEKKYGFQLTNAMVTDIPGQAYEALNGYVQQQIPYLSLGPNYVENLPDHGDRVGGVIRECGDQPFYWHPLADSSKRVLVWTAAKGYSYFHNIAEGQQQAVFEERISAYVSQLSANKYPYEWVQLRYTKHADNGPVDTNLCAFVAHWNALYSWPRLEISNLDTLFQRFEQRYGQQLPQRTGEISPYWEDGAYSTAREEIQARRLVQNVIEFEARLTENQKIQLQDQLDLIHRNLVLFHEHTWGSWCSISAPDIAFTTQQWQIKKSFLDSAQVQFSRIRNQAQGIGTCTNFVVSFFSIRWDDTYSGIRSLKWDGIELLQQDTPGLGACIYSLGISPQVNEVLLPMQNELKKATQTIVHPNLKITLQFQPTAHPNEFILRFQIDKKAIRDKEALHICLPFQLDHPSLSYGEKTMLHYPADQLAGSNKEFICVSDHLILEDQRFKITIFTPDCNLIELGAPINEQQQRGAKVWSRENQSLSPLYLYVFNNYWHTNYKADQAGMIELQLRIRIESVN